METFWFIALTFMITMYVVLDGFDLGAGIIYLFAAKNENERKLMLNSIGPYWDGNEVWLIAAGGILFFAFPKFYASSFSGFYLPLMVVLWLLIGRALGIELRKHALGNILTGVPVNKDGYFFEAFWTDFSISPHTGILDWFTVLMGFVAVCTLCAHGANYISMKTEGDLQTRARKISFVMNWFVIAFSIIALLSFTYFKPSRWNNYLISPVGFIIPVLALISVSGMVIFRIKRKDTASFVSSSLFIFAMLASTAYSIYPVLLFSTINPDYNLTVFNSKTGDYAMNVALMWWIPGILLVAGYFIFLFYKFRGKIHAESTNEGY
jgi:cytochrome d ubiquinol oxidase subunit II